MGESPERIESLTSRVFALPSNVADLLIVKIPSLGQYDLGPCSFPHLMKVIDLLANDAWADDTPTDDPNARRGAGNG